VGAGGAADMGGREVVGLGASVRMSLYDRGDGGDGGGVGSAC